LTKDANAVGSVGSTDIGKERSQGSQTETSSGMKPKRKKKKKIKNATNTAKAVNEGAGKVILQRFNDTKNQLVIEALRMLKSNFITSLTCRLIALNCDIT